MVNPIISFTAEVDVEHCYAAAKAKKQSFFIYYAYAIISAFNEVESFRLRVVSEPLGSEPEVYLYDVVDLITPIKISESGKYIEVCIPYTPSFDEFYAKASEIIAAAPAAALGDNTFISMDQSNTYACVSAMPTLHFSSATFTLSNAGGVNMISLSNVGKMVTREGRKVIPIAISAHHGLVDGGHVSAFFGRVQEILDSM